MTTLTLPLHRFKIFTIAPFYENVRESKNTILELNWVVLSFVQVRLRRPTLLSMHEHSNFFYRTDKEKRRVIMNCMANIGGMLRAYGRLTLGQEEDVRKRLKAIPNHSKPFYPQFSAHFLFLVFSLAIKLLRWTNNLLENTWKQYLL